MPRQQVYGKRSRAIYDALPAPLSSPEQQLPKPVRTKKSSAAPKEVERKQEANVAVRRSPRKALGEKSHNAVVLPVEAVRYAKGTNQPRVKRKGHIVWDSEDEEEEIKPVQERDQVEEEDLLSGIKSLKLDTATAALEFDALEQATKCMGGLSLHPHNSEPSTIELEQSTPLEPSADSLNEYEEHCGTLLDLSSHPLTCFETWSEQLSEHFAVTKIAEASFGEVYRLSLHEDMSAFASTDESVFKVIPLKAPESTLPVDKRKRKAAMTKQDNMTAPGDVATEVKVLQRMSAIPGFTNFRDVRILQGRPPAAFAQAFKNWNTAQRRKKKDLSHFPDPSKKTSYTDDQLWAVIEMQDAGTDLERLVEEGLTTSILSIWDIFWQVVLTLAKGEEGAEFEHRDLHLGNICVRSSTPSSTEEIDPTRHLNFTSHETTIIDYTISRCLMSPPTNEIAYQDLTRDPAIFEGDSTDEYQYDIYRYMRGALYFDEALADCHKLQTEMDASGRTWEQYHPQTNLVWLHLILYKLLEQIERPSQQKAPSKKRKEEYAVWKRGKELEKVLLKVQDFLDPASIIANGICSAGDLVVLALQEEWLGVEDVVGHHCGGDESALISQLDGLEL
ncbi:Serine/threonine-protein kinase haspin [Fulvia fulva]|uniref:non-specific serine/threonine protein kinase n=1 Tax=Passalora fulva TaxID=5499 RepID=A0A9Q8LHB5_PASFU|nr:Serine/threonine-protein kinase haspin [Fulvia fulva]KAK4623970.1 Serine/threonine-protein kinase haspin [Fulvia fulva]KAK4625235.1 Serine/threonine-protein kinase haspin [Fulvia fulva]UJO17480.1 Serine/threonine-protein kinase haspin [Fulvia fulva]WPV14714.1 Serine/threonine-protein kinase haspin [Fulvia fulva]WPV30234.1 Serine/threonine-protein kinase haspin [Fulvia fulva]